MGDPTHSAYDELPYDRHFFAMTHPDRMAAMASLHGMSPPPVDRCRTLELGCAGGGNLIAMAQSLPGSEFVGIDLSARQVAEGREVVARLGLANVRLEQGSILGVGDDLGAFDYIVCHGVYSWVGEEVRRKILAICARNLAEGGVAYVSYNTYPGWHLRRMIREMLIYHTREFSGPAERVAQARAFLDFLARSAPDTQGDYARLLGREAKFFEEESDTYLFHEFLEDENHPVYFSEFVAEAAAMGLHYLAPAKFGTAERLLSAEAREVIDALGTDRIRREQYLDFALNRTFRESLLCRAGDAPDPVPRPGALGSLRLSVNARPMSEAPDVRSGAPEEFQAITGERFSTGHAALKAALVGLYERWPRSAGLDELRDEVRSRLGSGEVDDAPLSEGLLQAHMARLVMLHTHEPRIADRPTPRPRASALARLQAEEDTRVVTLRLHNVTLDEFDALVLRLLDGTRDHAAILDGLETFAADGTLTIEQEDRPVADPGAVRAFLGAALDPSLARIARHALLFED